MEKTLPQSEGRFPAFLARYLPERLTKRAPLVPVLRFTGPIGAVTPLRPGLTLATAGSAIERAFSMRGAKAIAIQINSPGGSAVQSTFIYKRIRALAEEKDLKVYVFMEDVAASGGYMLALAGDEIYADPSSIVGSIGVLAAGFGFQELIAKIGVERRVYTAGRGKMTLDPFQPEKPEDVERIKAIQRDVHETFIQLVKTRRGSKIEAAGDTLFTGEFWSGKQALSLGLIDGLADLRSKMREIYGDGVRFRLVMPERGWFRRTRSVFAGRGFEVPWSRAGFADEVISAIEARALWSRFGL
jgi:signal peptide peptidase SppA